jgi:hypothetical protein
MAGRTFIRSSTHEWNTRNTSPSERRHNSLSHETSWRVLYELNDTRSLQLTSTTTSMYNTKLETSAFMPFKTRIQWA